MSAEVKSTDPKCICGSIPDTVVGCPVHMPLEPLSAETGIKGQIRYAVVYLKAGGYLIGVDKPPRPVTDGWYLIYFDDEGREGILGGPCESSKAALCPSETNELKALRELVEEQDKAQAALNATCAKLRAELADPPGDVQEVVLRKYGLWPPPGKIPPLERLFVEWWNTDMDNSEFFNRAVRSSPALAALVQVADEPSEKASAEACPKCNEPMAIHESNAAGTIINRCPTFIEVNEDGSPLKTNERCQRCGFTGPHTCITGDVFPRTCQHDLAKPNPTMKPQYPHHKGLMRYWCPICACFADYPISSAQSET